MDDIVYIYLVFLCVLTDTEFDECSAPPLRTEG